jgi:hypothetical protein
VLLIRNRAESRFFKVHAILTFVLVVGWFLLPQSLHAAVIPWILTLGVRSWAWQKRHFQIKKLQGA